MLWQIIFNFLLPALLSLAIIFFVVSWFKREIKKYKKEIRKLSSWEKYFHDDK